MTLIKVSVYLIILDDSFNNEASMTIFGGDNEDLINKWVCVIDYFITK